MYIYRSMPKTSSYTPSISISVLYNKYVCLPIYLSVCCLCMRACKRTCSYDSFCVLTRTPLHGHVNKIVVRYSYFKHMATQSSVYMYPSIPIYMVMSSIHTHLQRHVYLCLSVYLFILFFR